MLNSRITSFEDYKKYGNLKYFPITKLVLCADFPKDLVEGKIYIRLGYNSSKEFYTVCVEEKNLENPTKNLNEVTTSDLKKKLKIK